MPSRRAFLGTTGLAFLGLQRYTLAHDGGAGRLIEPFGPLIPDPDGILDLPQGFSYKVLARRGEPMSDGFKVPGQPDGMAAFAGPDGKVVLVCNHELGLTQADWGPFADNTRLPAGFDPALAYNPGDAGVNPAMGGTSNLVFDPAKGEKISHFLSLFGTDRNCAGGKVGDHWITCEEPDDMLTTRGKLHGWCYAVKATATPGLQKPVPLKALGRFRHEAVALDPKTGILYLTEDRDDGLLYRFVPKTAGSLTEGKLQALAVVNRPSVHLRNYRADSAWPVPGEEIVATWIDLDDIESAKDDLRVRGNDAGAARFPRSEGIHLADGAFYICCTNGGPNKRGQIFRLTPSGHPDQPDHLTLFLQPEANDLLTNGDNLCPAPWGGIVICEDLVDEPKPAAHVRCVTPEGKIMTLARNPADGEFAGCCFAPDGKWFFVNLQTRGMTVAVTGPWEKAV
ncbi:alkaline phosphatase PhoX [Haloferula sp. BvORR071]|uniref:alkaline phosphatase PhoX n=1 Tax=Haloferula sp. BvORR071 TaxID=1396141 RepID=UPI000556CCCC|nr:alkaline phosphatase PhoX [Haloferula sp. BvORR071]